MNDHRDITQILAAHYRAYGQHDIAEDLLNCRKYDPCGTPHCLRCEASAARRRRNRLYYAHGSLLDQHPRMQPAHLVTMTTKDIPVASLGDTLRDLNKATGIVLNSTGAYGWYRQFEAVPSCRGTVEANLHAHAVLFLPQRQRVTQEELYTTWSEALWSSTTGVTARSLKLELPDDFGGALSYWTKAEDSLALLTDPLTQEIDTTFFATYSEQLTGKQMHRFHNLPRC